jgi:hypothetical protein
MLTDGAVMLPVMSAVSVTETDFSARTSPSIVPSMTTSVASTFALTMPSRPIVNFWVRVIEPSILPLMTKSSSEDSSPLNLIVGPRIEVRSFKVLYGLLIDGLLGAGASRRIDRRQRMLRAAQGGPHQPRHKMLRADFGKNPRFGRRSGCRRHFIVWSQMFRKLVAMQHTKKCLARQ